MGLVRIEMAVAEVDFRKKGWTRINDFTLRHLVGAAGMKMATGGRVNRGGDIAFKMNFFTTGSRVDTGNG